MNKYLLALATVIHLIPHPFGVSPVGAMAIYSGACGDRRYAWAIPFLPLLVANLLFGFYDFTVLFFVYLGFALSSIAGWILTNRRSAARLTAAAATGAFIFYLVSNFSIWLVGMYPQTTAGLVQCYFNGLPYLGAGIVANLVYGALLFGLHALIEKQEPSALPA